MKLIIILIALAIIASTPQQFQLLAGLVFAAAGIAALVK